MGESKQTTMTRYHNGPVITFECVNERGESYERQGTLRWLYFNEIAYIDATDSLHLTPRNYFVRQGIDWDYYLKGIGDCWEHGMSVPWHFKFQKKINPLIIENFNLVPAKEKLQLIEAMRYNGILPKLGSLKPGFQPRELEWNEVAGLCIKTKQ